MRSQRVRNDLATKQQHLKSSYPVLKTETALYKHSFILSIIKSFTSYFSKYIVNIHHTSGLVLPLRSPQNSKRYKGYVITSHKIPMMKVLFFPFYRWGNWRAERLSNWPKFTVCRRHIWETALVFNSLLWPPPTVCLTSYVKWGCSSLFTTFLWRLIRDTEH